MEEYKVERVNKDRRECVVTVLYWMFTSKVNSQKIAKAVPHDPIGETVSPCAWHARASSHAAGKY